MDILKLLVLMCCAWRGVCAAPAAPSEGGFPAALAQFLAGARMPPARSGLVPAVLRDLELTLQTRWPDCRAVLFGSLATGLELKDSDVDVVITLPNRTDSSLDGELVTETSHILQRYPELFQVKEIKTSTVPIAVATHVNTSFKIDISFKTNVIQSERLINYFLNLDKRVRQLMLIVKYWAKRRGLSLYMTRFGIITMVIFFLQQNKILPSVASLQRDAEILIYDDWNLGFSDDKFEITNDESVCTLLGGFYIYYNNFNFDEYIASPYVGRAIEIELFKDLNTVSEEFELYKTNVSLNKTKPLNFVTPIVQDIFEHNRNIFKMYKNISIYKFVESVQNAVTQFRNTTSCTSFLENIVSNSS